MKLFYKTNKYSEYSITSSADKSWKKIQIWILRKCGIKMLLKDLSPSKVQTVVTNFYLKSF